MGICIRALRVTDHGDGLYEVDVEGRPLTEEQRELLEELFPNTGRQVEDALATEALLASVTRVPPSRLASEVPPAPGSGDYSRRNKKG